VITLLDSLNRPLAERVFFAHYNQQAVLQVSPGSAVYEKRKKVTVHFSLTNNGLSAPGQASVACAQANRFESSKQQDIESFCYLQAALHELPLYNKGRGYTDLPYLEQVMLVKGWRKFNQVVQDTLPPQSPGYYLPEISGTLVHARKKIKKPGTVTLMGNGFIGIVTDSSGHFDLSFRQLLVPQDRKLWMLAGERSTGEYHVEINDPFLAINRRMSAALHFPEIKGNKYIQYSQDLVVKGLASVNQLADVVVKARADRTIFGATSNECGDYVCSYNILNCPNHAGAIGSHAPVKGKQYRMPGGGTSIYWGCVFEEQQQGEAFLVYEGIKAGKTFYAEDFSATSNGMPEYISTLYWSPKLVFDKEGKAECSFYTGDIDGYFRIVVNGITAGNAFFATASFQVK
jgi:hypothetical protein